MGQGFGQHFCGGVDDIGDARGSHACPEPDRQNRIETSRKLEDDRVLVPKRLFDGKFVWRPDNDGNPSNPQNANETPRHANAGRQRACGERKDLPILIARATMGHQPGVDGPRRTEAPRAE